jgi:predicted nucleic acid-binding protein
MILVDSNVILDVWNPDPVWRAWSSGQLQNQSLLHELAIDPLIYAEISVSFAVISGLDKKLEELEIGVLNLPRQAAFLAGKAYLHYRRRGGVKSSMLVDFFIGAHAAVLGCSLLTRDTRCYATYFPTVPLVAP